VRTVEPRRVVQAIEKLHNWGVDFLAKCGKWQSRILIMVAGKSFYTPDTARVETQRSEKKSVTAMAANPEYY
jgi:hypothetical protein